ncbi:bifunctional oligoribonuclease/PAP phosphatase NrnA [Paenibacillus sp. N1-5-1-14]|uniref:DHH family phosphoesterase n=1 Tax=Paenibacillus radicibacter TaxID=2972488 RepID=UPI0021594743|nr:bifunctional oligoribonuclease/PAP phosphatase NrnA [Paenibacillus radicibacter]MCR8642145.1 bifunctional oligoribonuclease/PAP phosphatase NrnA [Paenibacillus radicibacter]
MIKGTVQEYHSQLQQAADFLRSHDNYVVVAHVQPDGDAAASTAAMGWMLQQLGKSFTMANSCDIPSKFHFLPGVTKIQEGLTGDASCTFPTIISVDCADFSRIGEISALFGESYELLNIDHHPTNDCFGNVHLIQPEAAATVEILYDLAAELNLTLDRDFANLIYAGLLTDTGGFRYASTSSKVMRMASELLDLGAQGPELAERLLERMTVEQMVVLQMALPTLSFSADRQIAWLIATTELIEASHATNEDLDGLVNYPRNIEGVEVGILFKQRGPDVYKVSLRSAGKVDVAQIAKHFGGGGHVRASGLTMEGDIDTIMAKLLEEVGKKLA